MEMFTIQEAAAKSGLSTSTLTRQIANGALVAEKMLGRWFVTPENLERYVQEHKGKQGFAQTSHPLHGKRGGGGRKKKEQGQ